MCDDYVDCAIQHERERQSEKAYLDRVEWEVFKALHPVLAAMPIILVILAVLLVVGGYLATHIKFV